jgi:hypothetical protein
MAKRQSFANKCGKKLLGLALDDYYFFDSDEVENAIDQALDKFKNKRRDWRKAVRSHLWSKPAIRDAICDMGVKIFGKDKH